MTKSGVYLVDPAMGHNVLDLGRFSLDVESLGRHVAGRLARRLMTNERVMLIDYRVVRAAFAGRIEHVA